MASLLITKETGGYYNFVINGDTVNSITNMRNDLLSSGNYLHFKTANGSNFTLTQDILPTDVILISDGTFTFTTVKQVFDKLIEVGFFDWILGGGTGTGVDRFDDLLDTFKYTDRNGQCVIINETEQRLETVVFYNVQNFTDLADVPNSLVPNKMLVTNNLGTEIVMVDLPSEPQQYLNSVGSFYYADSTTSGTPINLTGGFPALLTNDTLDTNTITTNAPYGISSIWNEIDNIFNFSELSVGDLIEIRFDLRLTTTIVEQQTDILFTLAEGTSSEVTHIIDSFYKKEIGTQNFSACYKFDISNTDVKNNIAYAKLKSENDLEITVIGFYIGIVRKNINIIGTSSDITNTSQLVNDGADGISPFITANDIPLETLQTVTDSENETTNGIIIKNEAGLTVKNPDETLLVEVKATSSELLDGIVNVYDRDGNLVSILADRIERQGGITIDYPTESGKFALTTDVPTVADATTTIKGIVKLAGDLGGTADSPTVPALADKLDIVDLPTKTSQFINDGQDGINPFITAEDLPSNLLIYMTLVPSDISGYDRACTTISDPDYPTLTDVSIPAVTTTAQLIEEYAIDPNILLGNPGVLNISAIGNVKKISGSGVGEFYFEAYHRDSVGTETLVATSNTTDAITQTSYTQFSCVALWNDGSFNSTDRVIIKWYANRISGGSNPVYQVQFGGTNPFRVSMPVPSNSINYNFVSLVGDQSIDDVKTFTSSPIVPTPTTDYQISTKKYVDDGLGTKQDSLGFTPEDSANKTTSITDSASTIKFPVFATILAYFSTSRIKTLLGQASTTIDGWLSSTDWNTFNNKQPALGFTPENISNKTDGIAGNETSTILYPSLRGLSDWLTGALIRDRLVISTLSGSNTGDETTSTIKSKLGISTLSGDNTGDETAARIGAIVNGATNYTTPLDADKIGIWDNANSLYKSVTWANIKATLKTYFDTLYSSRAPRETFVTYNANITPNVDTTDVLICTSVTGAMNFVNFSGTPLGSKTLLIMLKDDGTARAITFGTNYVATNISALPTTTTASTWFRIGLRYNSTLGKMECEFYG